MAVAIETRYTVKPAETTRSGRIPLSEWDQIGIITHVPTIYFYRPSQNRFTPSNTIIDTLKASLSRVLVPFYPLAGRFCPIGRGRLQLECNAKGIPLIEAVCEAKLDDFCDFLYPSVGYDYYDNLIPHLDYSLPIDEWPLVAAQVTKFKCGGISLGVTVSHGVVDGISSFHFVSEWANIARGEPVSFMPFIDRTVLTDRDTSNVSSPDDDQLPRLIGQSDATKVEERKRKIASGMLKLSKSQIDQLKAMANKSKTDLNRNRPFSRYETLSGHIWRCASKAREHKPEQPTAFCICADARNRLNPPLPKGYFGNATFDVTALSSSGDLTSNALGYAAGKIRAAINEATNEYGMSNLEFYRKQPDLSMFQCLQDLEEPVYGNPNLGVVSWLTLPMYGLDFGWGKEIYMGPGPHSLDGDSLILPTPEKDGSLIVAVCLQEVYMEAFKKFFYEGIQE